MSFGLFGDDAQTSTGPRTTGRPARHRAKPIGFRPLRLEWLEDRQLLTVSIMFRESADTGRDHHDLVTNKWPGREDVLVCASEFVTAPDLIADITGIIQKKSITKIGIYVNGNYRESTDDTGGKTTIPVGSGWERWNVDLPAPGYPLRDLSIEAVVAYGALDIPPEVEFVSSGALIITYDAWVPEKPAATNLLDSSDSGPDNQDNVTNVTQPAFNGTGERNAILRLYARRVGPGQASAQAEVVGETLVGSNGQWMVTASTLVDGEYEITATQEDLAGNISEPSVPIQIVIDTSDLPPVPGAQLGVWAAGSAYLDLNGNFVFDPEYPDPAHRDVVHTLGFSTDVPFTGNFCELAAGQADGFDKLAAYGRANGQYRWLVDFNNDGVTEGLFNEPAGFKNIGIPVAGNFDGNATNGDEVGVFTGSVWRFDTDHDFQLFDESPIASDLAGCPVVGDFDGDGADDLGTWDVGGNRFSLSLSSDGGGVDQAIAAGRVVLTRSFRLGSGYAFVGARERPVAADMDGDGIDDLGLWVPDRGGMTPAEGAEWYLLVSGGDSIVQRLEADPLNAGGWVVEFCPAPFGNDLFARFGDEYGIPLLGNFGPPGTGIQLEEEIPADAVASLSTIEAPQAEPDPVPAVLAVADPAPDDVPPAVLDPASDAPAAELDDIPQASQGDPVTVEEEIPLADAAESADTLEASQADADTAAKVVQLVGTPDDDLFSVMPGSTPDSWVVELNGVRQQYEGARVTIEFDGLEGTDTVIGSGSGSGEDEVAELWPDRVVVTGTRLSFMAENVESITVAGGGGEDTASLYDSPGDDSFWAAPDWVMLLGNGFFLHAQGFSAVTANAIRGGTDTAGLLGSLGDDTLIARTELAVFRGTGFDNAAVSFRRVSACGLGGNDLARLFDSALDEYPDDLEAADNWVDLSNNGLAYDFMAMDFDTVLASSSNARDSAENVDPDALDFILFLTGKW
jgi:hypothetical protein